MGHSSPRKRPLWGLKRARGTAMPPMSQPLSSLQGSQPQIFMSRRNRLCLFSLSFSCLLPLQQLLKCQLVPVTHPTPEARPLLSRLGETPEWRSRCPPQACTHPARLAKSHFPLSSAAGGHGKGEVRRKEGQPGWRREMSFWTRSPRTGCRSVRGGPGVDAVQPGRAVLCSSFPESCSTGSS